MLKNIYYLNHRHLEITNYRTLEDFITVSTNNKNLQIWYPQSAYILAMKQTIKVKVMFF